MHCHFLVIFLCLSFFVVPDGPDNGKISIIGPYSNARKQININTVLKYECNTGYKLSSKSPYVVCDQNWNTYKFPECEKKCLPKYSSSTTIISCKDKYGRIVSCDEAVDGTFLSYNCVPFYEVPKGSKKTINCIDGRWSFPNPICEPVCGKKIQKDALKLISGTTQDEKEYPWIVAIYKNMDNGFQNVCGGSLMTQRIVITAAHCVSNDNGNELPPEMFMVGAGKFYNKFEDPRDVGAQYSKVAQVVVHPKFRGESQRFLSDIALLITKDLMAINEIVQPICYKNLPNIYLHAGKVGVIAGWGLSESGQQHDRLRTLEIPYKYQTDCAEELPSDWADRFNTNDKICAGFVNKTKSVCLGDSGSGFYFKNPDDDRYYIHGLVSIAPAKRGECDRQQNALYTKVALYYNFVDREIMKQYVQPCTLPPHPTNGKWSITNSEKKPGDIVSSNTVLKVKCDEGYELPSTSAFVNCESASALPKCQLLCPKLNFPPATIYTCSNEKNEEIDCARAVEGSSLSFSCPEGYSQPDASDKVKFCKNGTWGLQKPECVKKEIVRSEKKVVCTYASWYAYDTVLPEDFNTTLCTHIIYSFISLSEEGDVRVLNKPVELDHSKKGLYRRFTNLKQKNENLKVLLSVGSTDGSDTDHFSSVANDETKKLVFIYSLMYFIADYNFDGANIEWFFPEQDDKTNYINLLRDLREKFSERGWLLTATVRFDPEGTGYDAKEMIKYLDWINVRTYGFYGFWSTYTGQTSPLYPSSIETDWERNNLNIEAASKKWVEFGVPKSKIVLSIAFYGSSFTLIDKSRHGLHAPFEDTGLGDGFLRYSEMCMYKNWTSTWDNDQKTVISYNGKEWVGHENKESVLIKATYVKDNGFLGVNVWPLDGDDVFGKCGPRHILLKHVTEGLGI